MSTLYPVIGPTESGIKQLVDIAAAISDLQAMIAKDTQILANPTSSLEDKFKAFQELSGYINGTDSRWQILSGSFNTKEQAVLKDAVLKCLKNYNDVEIPVSRDLKGNIIYARVYTDAAHTIPATAADLVQGWLNVNTDKATSVNFYFSYTSHANYKPSWSDTDNSAVDSACSHNPSHDTSSDPSKSVHVDVHDHACSDPDFSCSGDAQAIAGYCDYKHVDTNGKVDPNFKYDTSFDDYYAQNGWQKPK